MRPLALLALMIAVPSVFAQATPPDPDLARKSQEVQTKMRRVDLLLQMMPLALRKEQFPPLLSALEKIRKKQADLLSDEDKEIVKLGPELDETLKAAEEKGIYPKREVQKRAASLVYALSVRRQMARTDLADELFTVVDTVFDPAQKTIAAKSLDWKVLDPNSKLETKPEADQVKAFLRFVFLDSMAYEVLVDLQKRANAAPDGDGR